jgi:hypothetical protein
MFQEKTREERVKETVTLLHKLPKAGIPTSHEVYLEISEIMREWVKDGLPRSKEFDLLSHRGVLTLPATTEASVSFSMKVKKNTDLD